MQESKHIAWQTVGIFLIIAQPFLIAQCRLNWSGEPPPNVRKISSGSVPCSVFIWQNLKPFRGSQAFKIQRVDKIEATPLLVDNIRVRILCFELGVTSRTTCSSGCWLLSLRSQPWFLPDQCKIERSGQHFICNDSSIDRVDFGHTPIL